MKNKRANVVNDRPFSAAVLAKARKAVEDYRFAFWREDGRFVGRNASEVGYAWRWGEF